MPDLYSFLLCTFTELLNETAYNGIVLSYRGGASGLGERGELDFKSKGSASAYLHAMPCLDFIRKDLVDKLVLLDLAQTLELVTFNVDCEESTASACENKRTVNPASFTDVTNS